MAPSLRLRLSLLMFLQFAAPGAMLPMYSLRLVEELHFPPLWTAYCCSTQALAYVLGSWGAGRLADRWFAAERCLAVFACLTGATLWVLADLREPVAVFAATLIYWLLTGPITFLGTTICFAHLEYPERSFGPVRLWGTVGWMVPGWLLLYWFSNPEWLHPWLNLLRPDGPASEWADAFRLGGALNFVLFGYALTLPHTPPRREPKGLSAPLAALRLVSNRASIVFLVCTFGVFVVWPFTTQGTPLLLHDLGVSRPWMMPTLTLAQTSEIASLALLPMLILRLGVRGAMLLGLAAWTTALCLLGVGRPVELVIASLPLNGLLVSGFLVAGQMYLNRRAQGGLRAGMQALLTVVSGAAMLVGHLLLGCLRLWWGGDLPPAFALAAAATAVLLVVFTVGFSDGKAGDGEA